MSKVLVDRDLLDQLAWMELDTTERSIKIQDELRALLARPAQTALSAERDQLRAEVEAMRAQRDKMAQILRDLVPGCKWRFMRPRIDQALQEVDGGN